jgi:hypothetical protein
MPITKLNQKLTGAECILHERQQQIEAHNFTPEEDAVYDGELMQGAVAYIKAAAGDLIEEQVPGDAELIWPWGPASFRPGDIQDVKGRVDSLIKAGAMIAARIDVELTNARNAGVDI